MIDTKKINAFQQEKINLAVEATIKVDHLRRQCDTKREGLRKAGAVAPDEPALGQHDQHDACENLTRMILHSEVLDTIARPSSHSPAIAKPPVAQALATPPPVAVCEDDDDIASGVAPLGNGTGCSALCRADIAVHGTYIRENGETPRLRHGKRMADMHHDAHLKAAASDLEPVAPMRAEKLKPTDWTAACRTALKLTQQENA
ncbi:MAG: hypothetical protein ABSA83_21380 [Verrucomicrobiota bacterium]|jgi:hypothetical protein